MNRSRTLLESFNPATGNLLERYPVLTDGEMEEAVKASHDAFLRWRRQPLESRITPLQSLADLLSERADDLAETMAREMGKPLEQGRAEVEKCASVCRYYAADGPGFLAAEEIATEASRSYVSFEPLGLVLAVMPWNYPFWQVFRCAVPALLGGNGVLLKHAPNVPRCARAIEQLFHLAGFPRHLLRQLAIDDPQVATLIGDHRVQGVALTGSTGAGRAVASRAGECLKKTVLELGGSDPFIVLADADIEHAARLAAQSRLLNSGQSCIAAKRFLVVEAVRREFEEAMLGHLTAAVLGDPFETATTLGPQARMDLRQTLHRQVERSIARGARCLLGGSVPDGPGAFYPASLLTDVGPGMAVFDEEVFGPVAAVVPVADEAEAIHLANRSAFGLGAAVFTADVERGEAIARTELIAGACFVNDFVRSDPRLPFGGTKESGYGRELSAYGAREFVNVKTVYVR